MPFVRSVVAVIVAAVTASGCATGVGIQQTWIGGCLAAAGGIGGVGAVGAGAAIVAADPHALGSAVVPVVVGVGVAGLVVGAGIGLMAFATDAVVAEAVEAGAVDDVAIDRAVVETRLHALGVGFIGTGIAVGFIGAGATAWLMGSSDGPFSSPGVPITVALGTAALVGASVGTGTVLLLISE
ncbi:MAG TPA: hypothetical protein VGF99_16875 [Myxococcota bacterium]